MPPERGYSETTDKLRIYLAGHVRVGLIRRIPALLIEPVRDAIPGTILRSDGRRTFRKKGMIPDSEERGQSREKELRIRRLCRPTELYVVRLEQRSGMSDTGARAEERTLSTVTMRGFTSRVMRSAARKEALSSYQPKNQ